MDYFIHAQGVTFSERLESGNLYTRNFIGYSFREAKKLFKQELKDNAEKEKKETFYNQP